MDTFKTIVYHNPLEWSKAVEVLENSLNYNVSSDSDFTYFHCGITIQNQDERLVSACVVFMNENLKYEGNQAICFGKLLCINNQEAFSALMNSVRNIAKDIGISTILGPIDGSTWNAYRIAASNTEFKYFMDLNHPDYYIDLFSKEDLQIVKKYFSSFNDYLKSTEVLLDDFKLKFNKSGIQIRNLELENFEEELSKLYKLCNIAFADNFLFSPISFHQFRQKYIPIKQFIEPSFVLVAENLTGDFVGFLFACPDYLNKEKKGMIIKTLAKLPIVETKGLGTYLSILIIEACVKLKYDYMLHAFMEEQNNSIDISSRFDGSKIKTYNLYAL